MKFLFNGKIATWSYPTVLWRQLIVRHGGQVSSALDVSSLAKITDGYTPGHITTACKQVCVKG